MFDFMPAKLIIQMKWGSFLRVKATKQKWIT